jgi:hypothetical protein
MVGTLAVLKPSDGSREFGIYFHACNYNRAVLAFLKNGKANLQGPELAGEVMPPSLASGCMCRAL